MKNCYFTERTIARKSRKLLHGLKTYRGAGKIKFIPEQSALLIVDMQRYFLDENSDAYVPSAIAILPGIKKLSDAFREINRPIILTRHLNSKENAKLMGEWWSDLLTEKDELSRITPELNLEDATLIRKSQYDAFYQTDLEAFLKKKEIKQLVITGVMTHLCCETTVRSAFVRGFAVFFPIDGTATYNEDFHRAAFLNLSHGFAAPVLIEELARKLSSAKNG